MKPRTPSATETDLGVTMARALAGKDAATLRSLFTTPVEFLAVTPGRFWDADTAIGVVDDLLLGTWFGESTDIVDLLGVDSDHVGDVARVSYRMALELASGPAVVEQVAYYVASAGRITSMRLVCSGFRPTPEQPEQREG